MKVAGMMLAVITVLLGIALAAGTGYTRGRWGPDGVTAMQAALAICWVAGFAAAILVGVVASRWPSYVGQAVFGGTTVRMLVTGLLAVAYQASEPVMLRAFLTWLVIGYVLLLAAETTIGLRLVHRQYSAPSADRR